jgi:hypothetical protein
MVVVCSSNDPFDVYVQFQKKKQKEKKRKKEKKQKNVLSSF